MGPLAIRHAGLCEKLSVTGFLWHDKGDIIPAPKGATSPQMKHFEQIAEATSPQLKHFGQIAEANGRLYAQVAESLGSGAFPVVLGGDHSVAAGSIPAAAKHFGDIGLIWIDAHGDFNNDESTESGNMHGMAFSAVCGCGPAEMTPYARRFIDPKHAVQVGARDIDALEKVRLKEAGITVFTIHDIDRMGMQEIMRNAIEIAGSSGNGIHVSFDMDAVTPDAAPGVGTPVHSGLTVREAFLAMEMLHQCGMVLALDMVEVNPILDERNRTGILACELILSLLGKSVF
jgi:arginase